jgi:hypothetical protein
MTTDMTMLMHQMVARQQKMRSISAFPFSINNRYKKTAHRFLHREMFLLHCARR